MRPGPIKEKVIAEGAEIYCERRGIGPLLLLITGAMEDGWFLFLCSLNSPNLSNIVRSDILLRLSYLIDVVPQLDYTLAYTYVPMVIYH